MSPEILLKKTPDHIKSASELEVIMRAAQVQEHVRSQLWYQERADIDDLYRTGTTTCAGYAIMGSEELEAAGLPHYVGLANTHAAAYVITPDNIWLFDMLSPKLNKPVTNDLLYFNDSDPNRILARINACNITLASGDDYITTLSKNEWLSTKANKITYPGVERRYARHPQNLIITLFTPELGRKMVYQRKKFVEAYNNQDITGAAQALIKMKGTFPDLDLRTETPRCVKSIVRRLAAAKDFDTAREVAHAYFSSFGNIQDSRVAEYQGDCLRYIANHSGKKSLARRAMDLYEVSRQNPASDKTVIRNKINLCRAI